MAEAADSTTKKGATKGKKIKEELAKDKKKISDNRDNPVVVGNALIWSIGVAALAAGAYRKHQDGQLDWKLAGTVGGIVAVFGVADYFGSKYAYICSLLLVKSLSIRSSLTCFCIGG